MQPFLKVSVQMDRQDGYWIGAFPFCTEAKQAPDLIGYGLGTKKEPSTISLFLNPHNRGSSGVASRNLKWEKRQIAALCFPVACSHADISGNGFNDIVISDSYGPSMDDIWSEGGRVLWLENVGDTGSENWKQRFIGKHPGMHRLSTGHFSRKDCIQVIAVPIVTKSSDFTTPAPVIIYSAPANLAVTKKPWEYDIPVKLCLVHEVTVVPNTNGGLDKVLLAGREGITLLWYEDSSGQWRKENLGNGLPETMGNPFWGSGSVSLAKVHSDNAGYIATCEAFHGNHMSVYVKDEKAPVDQLAGISWTRHVLENFGPLNDRNTGSIHHVICADIDGDGVEEILVAMMGSDPPKWDRTGVWCYKPIDLENGKFAKFKLSDDSAARIAVADFRKRGVLDFATISYSVPGYFESPNPSINVFLSSPISVEKLDKEILFRIPRPSDAHICDEVEFLDVSGRILALVVIPKYKSFFIQDGDGIKVIAGKLFWKDKNGMDHDRSIATEPFTQVSIIFETADSCVHTRAEGAAFILFKKSLTSRQPPYSDMKQLVAHNIFPERFSDAVRNTEFPWVKVQDRPWAHGRFKNLEFYNLIGFHVRYRDDSDAKVCHIQLWTAGLGVSAGFHNHADNSFCEIHACMVNGTGKGGMAWATVPDGDFDPASPDRDRYDALVVPDMAEHGPLWRTGKDGLPLLRKNDTVDYAWHAWIAGDDKATKQSFDVWVAFEFPPFLAKKIGMEGERVPVGIYHIVNSSSGLALAIEDSRDGAAVILKSLIDGERIKDTLWDVSVISGTNLYLLQNQASGSAATVAWPPFSGQKITGSRSPATMQLTSAWALIPTLSVSGSFRLQLIATDFVLSAKESAFQAVLEDVSQHDGQKWVFKDIKNDCE